MKISLKKPFMRLTKLHKKRLKEAKMRVYKSSKVNYKRYYCEKCDIIRYYKTDKKK